MDIFIDSVPVQVLDSSYEIPEGIVGIEIGMIPESTEGNSFVEDVFIATFNALYAPVWIKGRKSSPNTGLYIDLAYFISVGKIFYPLKDKILSIVIQDPKGISPTLNISGVFREYGPVVWCDTVLRYSVPDGLYYVFWKIENVGTVKSYVIITGDATLKPDPIEL